MVSHEEPLNDNSFKEVSYIIRNLMVCDVICVTNKLYIRNIHFTNQRTSKLIPGLHMQITYDKAGSTLCYTKDMTIVRLRITTIWDVIVEVMFVRAKYADHLTSPKKRVSTVPYYECLFMSIKKRLCLKRKIVSQKRLTSTPLDLHMFAQRLSSKVATQRLCE